MDISMYENNFLYFDEGPHKYTDSKGNEYLSVTTMIHENYVPKFDKNYWLHKKARELGVSEKTLAKQWENITEEACSRGTNTHNGIENAIKDNSMFYDAIKYLKDGKSGRCITVADIPNLKAKPLDLENFKIATHYNYPEIYEVFQWYLDRGYVIYSEIGVYLPDILISGTIDILAIRPDKFVILDWKTNRNGLQFHAGYFKKDKRSIPVQLTNQYVETDDRMLPPLAHLYDCNGMHYTMQLSSYARMVELILGIPCVGCGLCHIASPFVKNQYGMPYKDENGLYPLDPNGQETVKWYHISYLRNEADVIFRDRAIYLNKIGKLNKQTTLQF